MATSSFLPVPTSAGKKKPGSPGGALHYRGFGALFVTVPFAPDRHAYIACTLDFTT